MIGAWLFATACLLLAVGLLQRTVRAERARSRRQSAFFGNTFGLDESDEW